MHSGCDVGAVFCSQGQLRGGQCAASPDLLLLSSPPCRPQVLVLAPTREIALQASELVTAVGAGLPPRGLVCGTFIGGLPIEEDERCLRR